MNGMRFDKETSEFWMLLQWHNPIVRLAKYDGPIAGATSMLQCARCYESWPCTTVRAIVRDHIPGGMVGDNE